MVVVSFHIFGASATHNVYVQRAHLRIVGSNIVCHGIECVSNSNEQGLEELMKDIQVCSLCVCFFSLLLKYHRKNMSYCTIEEAFGLSESFSNDTATAKAKRRKHKKKHAQKKESIEHHHMHEKNAYADTNQDKEEIYEAFVNSPSAHYQPQSIQQEAAFTRSFEPERIPDTIDVSMNSAPYQSYVEAQQLSAIPTMNNYEQAPQETLSSDPSRLIVSNTTPSSQSPQASVHEELEWMRNNVSHLTDKIDRLTHSLEAKQQHTQQTESSTQAYDTLVFVLVGMFVLVLVDVCFRAGQRFRQ